MDNVYAVIMAGGVGARFWPLSRRATPKQLLPIGPTDAPLLAETVRRIEPIVPAERVLVVTNASLKEATAHAVPRLVPGNILAEPAGRNTAPCIAWAAARVARTDPSAVLVVLPADHHIGDEPAYRAVLDRAVEAARDGALVTVGLEPTRPETGYGYIETGAETSPGVRRVARFVEKPDAARADAFLKAGNFLWNSGMFFFRADTILAAVRTFLPELARGIDAMEAVAGQTDEAAVVARTYPELPSISIDYGVMEKATDVRVVPGSFGWSDLGSWVTAWELAEKDSAGNAAPADAVLVESARNFVRAPDGKLVALIGVDDLVVVDTADALLVVPRERAQDVKRVVDALNKRNDPRT